MSKRILRKLTVPLACVLALWLVAAPTQSDAGLLSKLGRLAGDAGDVGRKVDGVGGSDLPLTALRAAKEPNTTALALNAGPDGSLRLVDELGRGVDLASETNLAAALKAANPKGGKVAIVADAKSLELAGDLATELASKGARAVPVFQRALPLGTTNGRLSIEVRPGISMPFFERTPTGLRNGRQIRRIRTSALREVNFALDKPLNRGTGVVAQVGKPRSGTRRVGFGNGPSGKPGETVTVSRDDLLAGFAGNRRGTVILAGRVEGDRLMAKGGPIPLVDIRAAAAEADVHLVMLDGPAKAAHNALTRADTYGDLLTGMVPGKIPVVIDAQQAGTTRIRLSMAPEKPLEPPVAAPTRADDVLTVTTSVADVAVRNALHSIVLDTRDQSMENDLSLRLIPGVPFWVHLIYGLNLLFGLYGSATAWRVWRRIWRIAPRPSRFAPVYIPRFLVFLLVFLPLTGIIWAIVAFFTGIWRFFMSVLRLIGLAPRRAA